MANNPKKKSNPRSMAEKAQMLDGEYIVTSPIPTEDPFAWVVVYGGGATEYWIHREGLFPKSLGIGRGLTFTRVRKTAFDNPDNAETAARTRKTELEGQLPTATWYMTKCECTRI